MRLFIGINIPKKLRTRIERATRVLKDESMPVRWIDPDNFHITMKFLGDVRRDQLPAVQQGVEKVAGGTKAFSTQLGGFGAFPTIRRPNVIWMGVGASPELRCLKQDLEWALGDLGFSGESRSFHPHITLGRADDGGGAGVFRGLDELMADLTFEGEFKVRSLDLMRSHLSRDGARYSVVESVRLGGG